MKKVIYESLLAKKNKGQRSFAVLIDPDNVNAEKIEELASLAVSAASPKRGGSPQRDSNPCNLREREVS